MLEAAPATCHQATRRRSRARLPRRALLAVALLAGATACGADRQTAGETGAGGTDANEAAVLTAASPVIQYLQEGLSLLGYYRGPVDGDRSPELRDAVLTFQHDKGLPSTGVFDGPTVFALAKASPFVQEYLVQALQTQLLQLELYRGPIDGKLDSPAMTEAVKALQRAAGITVDGVFGQQSFDALQARFDQQISGHSPTTTTARPTTATTATTATTTGTGSGADTDDVDLGVAEVTRLQQRLAALGYRPGKADGRLGMQTASALLAFQKREGLPRNSEVTADVLARLERPTGAGPRSSKPGPRVEIDLDRQILFFVSPTGGVTTINTSTGSGETYHEADGSTSVAYTPTGTFAVFRVVDGPDVAPLGTLYRPLYFHRGWAIHGSPLVPAYPASHGCARTANWDQDFLFPAMPIGSQVVIYGTSIGDPGRAAPGF